MHQDNPNRTRRDRFGQPPRRPDGIVSVDVLQRQRGDGHRGVVQTNEVPRAAVVRAAVSSWLATNESADPVELIEAIRGGLVKRGRKTKPQ